MTEMAIRSRRPPAGLYNPIPLMEGATKATFWDCPHTNNDKNLRLIRTIMRQIDDMGLDIEEVSEMQRDIDQIPFNTVDYESSKLGETHGVNNIISVRKAVKPMEVN